MKKRYISAGIIFAVGAALLIASRVSADFADWYSQSVYPILETIVGYITGVFPFSLGEILLCLLLAGIVAGIVFLAVRVIKNRGYRLLTFFHHFSHFALLLSVLFFIMTANCLVNYNRKPFSEYAGLTVTEYSKAELLELTAELIENVNACAGNIKVDENNLCAGDPNMLIAAKNSADYLGGVYDVLKVYYPPAKPVIFSEVMSAFNTCGIFSPFTVEANYNNAMPEAEKGFTICHELSHLSGFMREDEANYIAYLACRTSMNSYLKYSGYYSALVYALSACNKICGSDEYSALYSTICPQVQAELANRSVYWAKYQSTPAAAVSHAVNDAYLKSNNQADGERSYGRMVDLMIADYLSRTEVARSIGAEASAG